MLKLHARVMCTEGSTVSCINCDRCWCLD